MEIAGWAFYGLWIMSQLLMFKYQSVELSEVAMETLSQHQSID